ncbi:Alcohol dehydrogenase GroES-like domain protein [Acididesulfobacillus acetoxydans]|uniref:Alcohol dehydrogenase GroES-like domain protein n=2 Tax=Acididesulfobacillus acetoxydans TaxID=1561005 RepID=A0A8S0W1Y3_9FIRM|nr:zinc-binding dehydrogenase [Acididesulfobacillus acetoxydans]CAA7600118.1 Alcohol dehydrogenase GroES-like domain protein [Acididesulfobacillus acetoxydans]
MKTKAVRLYGANDLRMEEFELPEIEEDEILVEIISDSVCMSTYKAAILGKGHKRVPQDVDRNPIIVGHEFSGNIVKVGAKLQDKFQAGNKFALQPALNYKGTMWSPGYSYKYFGGDATYNIIPKEVMEINCLLDYRGDTYYEASLAEPMSCIIGAFHASYHTHMGSYEHRMGIVEGGKMALLAAAGPMGLGAVDYALHCDRRPGFLVVTDIDEERIGRAKQIFTQEEARKCGVELHFVNTKDLPDVPGYLKELTGGSGYDDVLAFTPVKPVVELADKILGRDGCLNFFAGPTDNQFSAEINFYNVHYSSTHVMGTTGGNTDDMIESLKMTQKGLINPAVMVTHIGGLDAAAETVLNLPHIPGGKKLIYTHINMELTALDELAEKGERDPRFARLAEIVGQSKGLWCDEAEKYLLENWK